MQRRIALSGGYNYDDVCEEWKPVPMILLIKRKRGTEEEEKEKERRYSSSSKEDWKEASSSDS
jgi:hypothetical protein